MRFKKKIVLFGILIFILIYLFLYRLRDQCFTKNYQKIIRSSKFMLSERHPQQIQVICEMEKKGEEKNATNSMTSIPKKLISNVCEQNGELSETDIQMYNVYSELKFDNTNGGSWKQGWEVHINKNRWHRGNKLKVFVVPHSHNDPGWKKTFEQYYDIHTRHIFNNMLGKLSQDPRKKFIWAEVSYLSLWWSEISESAKKKFKELVDNGQIEIVSGGWVMPDEASSHYYSLIQQLIHGHEWLHNNLNVKPNRSWCIDPFGVSPTMPFLLQRFGLKSLVIQRTHYSVKKYLARNKQLEFRWRQLWDNTGKSDFMTHMMPFYSYDIPHTCGPDPAICCQFDFRRSMTSGMICPWKTQPQMINDKNVAVRADMLLNQYRKKAELYLTNALLVPLGDDFRYDISQEWDLQYENYQKLFDYMNNNPTFYIEVKFSTLDDYFRELEKEKSHASFPSLSGDFFTYADRDDHYWSGYYTSRPYYKRMDREFISHLRSAEILHAVAWKSARLKDTRWLLSNASGFISMLRNARGSLSLFQHHDGITGTATDYVVNDYAQKLERGMNGAKHVMQQALNFLLNPMKHTYQPDPQLVYFELKESREVPFKSRKVPFNVDKGVLRINEFEPVKRIVIFNSLTWHRTEILSVKVDNYENIEVCDENDLPYVAYQINPYCDLNDYRSNCFLLYFEVNVKPLEIKTLFIKYANDINNKNNIASLGVFNDNEFNGELKLLLNKFPRIEYPISDFNIENDQLSVTFRPNGLMKAITLKKYDLTIPVHLSFIEYRCRRSREMCGAYLFLPDGDVRNVRCVNPLMRIIKGALISSVIVHCNSVIHAIHLYSCSGSEGYGIEIQNLVDIKTQNNFEIAMKVSTNIKNNGVFYTDLNGYQMIKRQYLKKLPLQGNYYPMPSAIYIEDEKTRMTLVSAQPLGAASLNEGEIEVMQDRRLNQDDNLGLGQGVMDNRPILHIFRLVLEKRIQNCQKSPESHLAGYLSVVPYLAMNAILYPVLLFVQTDVETNQNNLLFSYNVESIERTSTVDVHIVSMTTVPETLAVGFTLHRPEIDICFYQEYEKYSFSNGLVNVSSYISCTVDDVIYKSSLSYLQIDEKLNKNDLYSLCAMDLSAFYVTSINPKEDEIKY